MRFHMLVFAKEVAPSPGDVLHSYRRPWAGRCLFLEPNLEPNLEPILEPNLEPNYFYLEPNSFICL